MIYSGKRGGLWGFWPSGDDVSPCFEMENSACDLLISDANKTNKIIMWNEGTGEPSLTDPPPQTAEKIKANRIAELQRLLMDSDYIGARIAEGSAAPDHYAALINQRAAWRTELQTLLSDS